MLQPFIPGVAEWHRDDYLLTSDPEKMDLEWVHRQLSEKSYWAQGQSLQLTLRSLAASMPFSIWRQQQQVGFGRLVTDYSRFAYLLDVIIDESERGKGLGGWLAATIVRHPELRTVKRWMLATSDAHGVYQRAGWQSIAEPERLMEYHPFATPAEDPTR